MSHNESVNLLPVRCDAGVRAATLADVDISLNSPASEPVSELRRGTPSGRVAHHGDGD